MQGTGSHPGRRPGQGAQPADSAPRGRVHPAQKQTGGIGRDKKSRRKKVGGPIGEAGGSAQGTGGGQRETHLDLWVPNMPVTPGAGAEESGGRGGDTQTAVGEGCGAAARRPARCLLMLPQVREDGRRGRERERKQATH